MIWYHLIFSDNKKAVGYAWNLMGFVAKLAQGVSTFYLFIYLGKLFSLLIFFSFYFSSDCVCRRSLCGEVEIDFLLDRDAPRMKGIPEEHEKRRSVFWELLNMDCRMVCCIRLFDRPILLTLLIFFLKNRVFHLDDHLQYS